MTTVEIIHEIHRLGIEIEVYNLLQKWLLDDRSKWISRAMDSEASLKAIHKIAIQASNSKTALEGIANLSER